MRILVRLETYGAFAAVQKLQQLLGHHFGEIKKIGQRNPSYKDEEYSVVTDWWELGEARFSEHMNFFLNEILQSAHEDDIFSEVVCGLAIITIKDNHDEDFACLINSENISMISKFGFYLEISPEATMPPAKFHLKD